MLGIKIVLAIIYFISPIDLIPEAVFGIFGYVDDVAVIVSLCKSIGTKMATNAAVGFFEELLYLCGAIFRLAVKIIKGVLSLMIVLGVIALIIYIISRNLDTVLECLRIAKKYSIMLYSILISKLGMLWTKIVSLISRIRS